MVGGGRGRESWPGGVESRGFVTPWRRHDICHQWDYCQAGWFQLHLSFRWLPLITPVTPKYIGGNVPLCRQWFLRSANSLLYPIPNKKKRNYFDINFIHSVNANQIILIQPNNTSFFLNYPYYSMIKLFNKLPQFI